MSGISGRIGSIVRSTASSISDRARSAFSSAKSVKNSPAQPETSSLSIPRPEINYNQAQFSRTVLAKYARADSSIETDNMSSVSAGDYGPAGDVDRSARKAFFLTGGNPQVEANMLLSIATNEEGVERAADYYHNSSVSENDTFRSLLFDKANEKIASGFDTAARTDAAADKATDPADKARLKDIAQRQLAFAREQHVLLSDFKEKISNPPDFQVASSDIGAIPTDTEIQIDQSALGIKPSAKDIAKEAVGNVHDQQTMNAELERLESYEINNKISTEERHEIHKEIKKEVRRTVRETLKDMRTLRRDIREAKKAGNDAAIAQFKADLKILAKGASAQLSFARSLPGSAKSNRLMAQQLVAGVSDGSTGIQQLDRLYAYEQATKLDAGERNNLNRQIKREIRSNLRSNVLLDFRTSRELRAARKAGDGEKLGRLREKRSETRAEMAALRDFSKSLPGTKQANRALAKQFVEDIKDQQNAETGVTKVLVYAQEMGFSKSESKELIKTMQRESRASRRGNLVENLRLRFQMRSAIKEGDSGKLAELRSARFENKMQSRALRSFSVMLGKSEV